jgi:hypothetical protein
LKRRQLLKHIGLAASGIVSGAPAGIAQEAKGVLKPAITVVRITDVLSGRNSMRLPVSKNV